MADFRCPQCGAPIDPGATECRFCGERFAVQQPQAPYGYAPQQPQAPYGYAQQQPQPQVVIQQAPAQQVYVTGINPAWPIKSKVAAGLLAIFFGGLGIHKFYLGQIGMGIIYLLFCWTFIPEFIGFIEGIIYLCSNDENFQLKNHVRLG